MPRRTAVFNSLFWTGPLTRVPPREAPDPARRPAPRHGALLELQLHGRQVRADPRLGAARLLVRAIRHRRAPLLEFTYAREGSLAVRRRDVLFMTGAALAGIWLN